MIGIILENGEAAIVSFGTATPLPGNYDSPEAVVSEYNRQIGEIEAKYTVPNCSAEDFDDWEKPLTY